MARRNAAVDVGLEALIRVIRGHRVMLDRDLAELYGMTTSAVNQAVSRNLDRFPAEFMFRLTAEEFRVLKSQFVTSNAGRGGSRRLPLAFTEHVDDLEAKYDASFKDVFDAIRALMQPPSPPRRPIGFRPGPRHQTARLLGRAAGRRGMDGDGRSS